MKEINEDVKRHLKRQYENACNDYLVELANMWEIHNIGYGFWVGGDVGGTYSFNDDILFIDMNNLRYCVENDVLYDEYSEWLEYCVWASDFNQPIPSLDAWHNGCKRVDAESRERISTMHHELMKACDELNEKF